VALLSRGSGRATWARRAWRAIFMLALRRCGPRTRGGCANRWTTVFDHGPVQVTVVLRDTREPDGRSREELVEMLAEIRRSERETGWRVPEPDASARVPD
jgi:hypothetical protein